MKTVINVNLISFISQKKVIIVVVSIFSSEIYSQPIQSLMNEITTQSTVMSNVVNDSVGKIAAEEMLNSKLPLQQMLTSREPIAGRVNNPITADQMPKLLVVKGHGSNLVHGNPIDRPTFYAKAVVNGKFMDQKIQITENKA